MAKNTKAKQVDGLYLAATHAKNIKGLETSKPTAQMWASILGYFSRSFWAIKVPDGTPAKPAIIAITPNLYATL